MKKNKLLIVGGGMAGVKFAEELVAKTSKFSITILNQERYAAYNRIMLSPVLAGDKKFSDIYLHDDQWYLDHDISVLNACVAKTIDHDNKRVVFESDEQISTALDYDQLVLATGSDSFKMPIPGCDAQGVLTFRTKDDVDDMLRRVQLKPENNAQKKRCVVIGAGLLGLEAANALAMQGAEVVVVNRGGHILNRQLNDKAAGLLQKYFENKNITFSLNANSSEITCNENNQVTGLKLADGTELPADLIVMAVGVRPNKDLAESSSIECDKGILVDAQMRTNMDDVYAIGECIQFDEHLFGLVAPAYEQAAVLVNHLCRSSCEDDIDEPRFEVKPVATKLKVSGIDLFSAGDIEDKDEYQFVEYEDYASNVYKRLSIYKNKIVGAVLFGDVLDGAWYFDLLNQQTDVSAMRSKLLFGKAICEPNE